MALGLKYQQTEITTVATPTTIYTAGASVESLTINIFVYNTTGGAALIKVWKVPNAATRGDEHLLGSAISVPALGSVELIFGKQALEPTDTIEAESDVQPINFNVNFIEI